MTIVGPDGKPVGSVKVEAGEKRCIFCVAQEKQPARFERRDCLDGYVMGLLQGYFIGSDLMGSVLAGSGMPPEMAAKVQEVASSLCEECAEGVKILLTNEVTARSVTPVVEQAITNIRAGGVFVVGRSAGKVRGAGP